MHTVATILNIKGHYAGIGSDKKFLYGPCDIEGHIGKDGKYYIIDTARVMPPDAPPKYVLVYRPHVV